MLRKLQLNNTNGIFRRTLLFKARVDVFHPPALSFTQYSSTQQASPKGALNGKSNQKVLAGIRTADNGSFYHRLYRAV
ncbi:MAG: hypothetical protein IKD59_06860, partial [Lachnospiraceae bacterium]|nr:hypothetical protein [Lachnospiraceae bacterium]